MEQAARFACWVAGIGVVSVAALASSLWATPAGADASYASPYTLGQTYSAALRLIRVDNGFQITERDPEAAYILFEYEHPESGTRITPGAIELIPRTDRVTVLVKLPKMPRYHEEALANALRRKLETEYGDPPPRTKPRPPDDTPDAGRDASRDARSDR
jgi:hypothetical protein